MRYCLKIILFLVLAQIFPHRADGGSVPGRITIAAVGDVMMGSDYPEPLLPRDGGKGLLRDVRPFLRKADIAMANLEGPLCDSGTPAKAPRDGATYLFRVPTGTAAILREAGVSMASLANNHALDFGLSCHERTKSALRDAGIAFSSKKGEVAEFDIRGVRVGIIALSFGPPPRSIVYPRQALAELARASKRYDVLILSVHSGAEGRKALRIKEGDEYFLDTPRGNLVRFAHDAIDNGADLVIAHGPHVPRAMEHYRGRLIAYSLGNFCTYGGINVSRENGYAPLLFVDLERTGAFAGGKVVSFLQKRLRGPRLDPDQRAFDLIRRLTAADFPDSGLTFAEGGAIFPRVRNVHESGNKAPARDRQSFGRVGYFAGSMEKGTAPIRAARTMSE